MFTSITSLALVATASASTLWDGRLNDYSDASFLGDWSFSNAIGPYQYYIHGSGSVSDYVALSTEYKNPADTASDQGIQITIDDTSSWHGQTMMRTELIPQTTAAINAGKVFYHFSVQHTGANPPSQTEEHQVCFFESHFTELKYGLLSGASGISSNVLRWMANSETHWNTTFEAGVWHNIAYGIDFGAQTVSFYHSTGGDDLELTAGPVSASTSSNGADWHLGVLRLPGSSGDSGVAEDWHFSGVYIENELTAKIGGGSASSPSNPAKSAVPTSAAASTPAPATPTPDNTAPAAASTAISTQSAATRPVSASRVATTASNVATTLQTSTKPPFSSSSSSSSPPSSSSPSSSSPSSSSSSPSIPNSNPTSAESVPSSTSSSSAKSTTTPLSPQNPIAPTTSKVHTLTTLTSTSSAFISPAPSSPTTTNAATHADEGSGEAKPTKALPKGYQLRDLQQWVAYLEQQGWEALREGKE